MNIIEPSWEPYVWIIVGVLIMIGEFVIPGTFVVFIGFGAVVTGVCSLFFPIGLGMQILIMAITTGVSILFGSAFIKKVFPSTVTKDEMSDEPFRNDIVTVQSDILVNQKGGRIRYQGTDWDAYSEGSRISKGERVRILRRDNLTFIVEPLEFRD
ncbi:MAG: NfeD family protein [Leptospira sp.]|nr:NfeD family protein [Leptospira sp.]